MLVKKRMMKEETNKDNLIPGLECILEEGVAGVRILGKSNMPWNQQSWVHVFWHPVESVVLPFQGTLYVMNAFWTTDQKWSNWLGKSVYLSKHFQCAFFIFYSLSVWILADAKWLSVSWGKKMVISSRILLPKRETGTFFSGTF